MFSFFQFCGLLQQPDVIALLVHPYQAWHTIAVVAITAVLAASGLHFVFGYLFGLYRSGGILLKRLSYPSFIVWLLVTIMFLGAYLIGTNSYSIAKQIVTTDYARNTAPIVGKILLDIIWGGAASTESSELNYRELEQAIAAISAEEFEEDFDTLHEAILEPDASNTEQLISEYPNLYKALQGFDYSNSPLNALVVHNVLEWASGDYEEFIAENSGGISTALLQLNAGIDPSIKLSPAVWESISGMAFIEIVFIPSLSFRFVQMAWVMFSLALLISSLLVYFLTRRQPKSD